ncbi:MAG: citrate/2-methylcitrate synthase [Clostridia bacterium]|nr:citrate/2-methylcitrate synthase [Clostridia bacterium]
MSATYNVNRPELDGLCEKILQNDRIDPELYTALDVKRGLRDLNGKGVLAGLTEVSDIIASTPEGESCDGRLYYRGIRIEDIVGGAMKDGRFSFEEAVYLLLFGELPRREELDSFASLLGYYRSLPNSFVRDVIMKAPSPDMMNSLARSVLTLYSYDETPDDTSIYNVLRQCLQLIAQFPLLSVYSYLSSQHYHGGQSLFNHAPQKDLSTAENILYLLRPDNRYTPLEAKVLDLCLTLHAEHGGGNNSTFTTHVVTSSGTDTYSSMAASLGSLKGPRHGGANCKVVAMFENIKENLSDWEDEEEIAHYLSDMLDKKVFDRAGLIYGMGHAVYSLSDPRATILRSFVDKLAGEKGAQKEYALYARIERIAPEVIREKRRIYKGVSANVDFYSGFVYHLLGLPRELFTPVFAIARIAGWSAHRLEELANSGKIIRPAYRAVMEHRDYVPLDQR